MFIVMQQVLLLILFAVIGYAHTIGYAELTKTKLSLKRFLTPVLTAGLIGAVIGLTGLELPYVLESAVDKSAPIV